MFAQIFSILALAAGTLAVDLKACDRDIHARLANESLAPDDAIFHFNGTHYMSDPGNLQLTIRGCKSECTNPDFDLYEDMWPRLLTWLFPVLLMIGNLYLPKIGHVNRLLVTLHYIGDPIDSMWSLLTKAEVWNRFYHIALRHMQFSTDKDIMARSYAALLAAFDELAHNTHAVQDDLDAVMNENAARLSREDMDYILAETADELADSRTNETLRTAVVIVNYLWTVVASLHPRIGGEQSSQPGGRIGTAMFLSWIVSTVLLGNTLSGFTSRRTCLRIVERYLRTIKGRRRDLHYFPNSPHLASRARLITSGKRENGLGDYFDSQPWNGNAYSYRKDKRLVSSRGNTDKSSLYLLSLASFPVVVATACAFVILYETPNVGLGCRTLWVIGLGGALLLSPALTYLLNKVPSRRAAWYLVVLKDAFIAIPVMTIVILSSIGIFNTCWCWSAVYSRGLDDAFVILDVVDERQRNGMVIYPALVALCLGLQVITYLAMYQIMKPGGRLFRLAEKEKDASYKAIHSGRMMDTEQEMTAYKSPAYDGRGSGSPLLGISGSTSGMQELELPPPAVGQVSSLPLQPASQNPSSLPASRISQASTSAC